MSYSIGDGEGVADLGGGLGKEDRGEAHVGINAPTAMPHTPGCRMAVREDAMGAT